MSLSRVGISRSVDLSFRLPLLRHFSPPMPKHVARTADRRGDIAAGSLVNLPKAQGSPVEPVTESSPRRSRTGLVRAGNRPAELVSFDDDVVSFFVEAADMLGVPKSVAAIYGICFASAEPLSFSQIDDRLEISSGSISQGLRVLREVGALKLVESRPEKRDAETLKSERSDDGMENRRADRRRDVESRPGSRELGISPFSPRGTARYEPDLELRKLVLHWIEKRLQGQLSAGRSRLKHIMAGMPATTSGGAEKLHARFESLQTWQEKAHSLLPVAKTFLKLT